MFIIWIVVVVLIGVEVMENFIIYIVFFIDMLLLVKFVEVVLFYNGWFLFLEKFERSLILIYFLV